MYVCMHYIIVYMNYIIITILLQGIYTLCY